MLHGPPCWGMRMPQQRSNLSRQLRTRTPFGLLQGTPLQG